MKRNNIFQEDNESDACGTMVCEEVPDFSEMYEEGVAGEVVEPSEDEETYLAALESEVLEDEEVLEHPAGGERGQGLVQQYFHSLGDIRVLSRDQETALAKKLDEGRRCVTEIVKSLPLYSRIEASLDVPEEEKP